MAAWPDGRDAATESTGLMAPRALKRTGIVAGVAAGAVGIAYATERALVARLRHRDDPDAGLPLVPEYDAMRDPRQPRRRHHLHHLRGATGRRWCSATASRSRRASGRSSSSRSPPPGSAPWPSTPAGTASRWPATPATRSTTSPTTCAACSRASTCATWCSSGTRWAGWRCRRSPSATPTSLARARVRVGAAVDLVAQPGRATPAASARRSNGSSRRVPTSPRSCATRNLGFLLARIGFGDDPHPSHVEATREMLAACSREHDPRRRHRAAQPRPHRGTAVDRRARPSCSCGTADALDAAARLAPHRRADPRSPPGRVPGRRPHAHVRAHRERSTRSIMEFAASARPAAPAPARSTRAPPPRPADVITDVPGVPRRALDRRRHRRDRRGAPARDRRLGRDPRAARPRPGRPRCSTRSPPSSTSTRSCSPAVRRSVSPPPTA